MLSAIYQLAYYFELQHGHRPNTLLLNPAQFSRLRQAFARVNDMTLISNQLNMMILISREIQQARVARLPRRSDNDAATTMAVDKVTGMIRSHRVMPSDEKPA